MGRANVNSAANTGAPCEDGTICRDCHLGGNFGPISESVTLVDQITGLESTDYVPGMRYDVTISVIPTRSSSRYGFQATVLDTNHLEAGTWMNPSNSVQISTANIDCHSGTRTYVEHALPNFTRNFRMEWQAPSCDIGPITFYTIGNAVNFDQSTSGDFGGTGNSHTYLAGLLPNMVAVDSSNIPSGSYLAEQEITLTGAIVDSNKVLTGANQQTILIPTFEVEEGAELTTYNTDCIEE